MKSSGCRCCRALPLPGEATLIAAAVYAGKTHHLNIWGVIAAGAAGAILGDNIGFWVGREIGYRLLLRYGHYVYLTDARIKLGQYLFLRHGGKIVFFGRFVAMLRAFTALLAGANNMSWPRFLLFNAAGSRFGAVTRSDRLWRTVGSTAVSQIARRWYALRPCDDSRPAPK